MAATTLFGLPDEAFERLFVDEYPRVVSIAFRITRDRGEAEDVAQDVFVRAYRSGRTPVRGWLYTSAVRAALNAIRSRRRRSARETRQLVLETSLGRSAERERDPQRIVERHADTQAVRAALLRIARRDAELLALRYAGLSYRELSTVLGVDATQIGTRLARAERALKKEIQRETLR
ncbi:MAG TPA: sigma-70 family RNA polymerase sigma factor [Candidatus Baltobacteraceae bacterium]|nr:sigma-70 family RNA polymerase sigma factor [Candidatus Baltobacteraceae bacterium]